jgi:DNA-directed RNA polymerase specialized sigma24 family protein
MTFPATRQSVVLAFRSPDPAVRERAFDAVASAYWRPVYKYVRLQWRATPEEAQDLTQGFFTDALEKGHFRRFDQERARFRTFLRTCLDGFVSNQRKAASRLKRGGGLRIVPLDFQDAEGELRQHELPAGADLDEYFHREWIRSLLALAVDALRRECAAAGRDVHFALFQRYDLEGPDAAGPRPSYQDLARDFGLPVTQVTNYLAAVRRDFRRRALETLREQTASDEEFRAEARDLFGVDPS